MEIISRDICGGKQNGIDLTLLSENGKIKLLFRKGF
jgi:hypothetical protein